MDWNRTKSIFIFVFLILNIFLYTLYVNRYNEAKDIEVPGEKTIEARLKMIILRMAHYQIILNRPLILQPKYINSQRLNLKILINRSPLRMIIQRLVLFS